MISVLTPVRKGEQYSYDIANQTTWHGQEYKRYCHSCTLENNRRENEAFNRNSLKAYATDPVIIMDADVICPDNTTFYQMLDFLETYDMPAVAVDTKNRSDGNLARDCDIGHTIIALVAMRKRIMDALIFMPLNFMITDETMRKKVCLRELPEAQACVCTQANLQIRTMTGMPIPYLRNVRATEGHNVVSQ